MSEDATWTGRAVGGPPAWALAVVLALTSLIGFAPPAAAEPITEPIAENPIAESMIAGYDWATPDRDAALIAGAPTNLVVRYVATSELHDATVHLDLPRDAWPDLLNWWGWGLSYLSPGGSVAVRPSPESGPAAGGCDAQASVGSVSQQADTQRITVEHVNCEPGELLTFRIFGITAPRRPGDYLVQMSAEYEMGGEGTVLLARVVRQPRTRLLVSMPRKVRYDAPVTLIVRAVRPDGRIDRSYRGGVRLSSAEGPDCVFDAQSTQLVHDFTAADAGVHRFRFTYTGFRHRLEAVDVGREARSGRGPRYRIVGMPDHLVCPISFH